MNAALADYQQSLLAAFGQVADSLEALDHDQELLASEQAALEIAAQSLALTRESYSAGNSGVLQVLDAQRQNQQARLGLVRVQGQRYQDTVQLLLALGGAAAAMHRSRPAAQLIGTDPDESGAMAPCRSRPALGIIQRGGLMRSAVVLLSVPCRGH